jgi:hypothetical protein
MMPLRRGSFAYTIAVCRTYGKCDMCGQGTEDMYTVGREGYFARCRCCAGDPAQKEPMLPGIRR